MAKQELIDKYLANETSKKEELQLRRLLKEVPVAERAGIRPAKALYRARLAGADLGGGEPERPAQDLLPAAYQGQRFLVVRYVGRLV